MTTPGTEERANQLQHMLRSRTWQQRREAVRALARLATPLDSYPWAVDLLIQTLGDASAKVRQETLAALRRSRSRSRSPHLVEPVVDLLAKDPAWAVRARAAELLGDLGDPRAVEPLEAALASDPFFAVCTDAAEALGRLGDRQAAEPLRAALVSDDPASIPGPARYAAARSLLALLGEEALPVLGAALTHPALSVRMAAADALERWGGAQAVEMLMALLDDPAPELRRKIVLLLMGLGERCARTAPAAAPRYQEHGGIASVLGPSRAEWVVERLIGAMRDPEPSVRPYAARALGALGSAPAAETLIAALDGSDPDTRAGAARGLGALGDVRAVEPLLAALGGDPDWRVRAAAAQTLGALGDVRAVAPLISALDAPDWWERIEAVDALGRLGDPQALAPLRRLHKAFGGGRSEGARHAARAIDQIERAVQAKAPAVGAS